MKNSKEPFKERIYYVANKQWFKENLRHLKKRMVYKNRVYGFSQPMKIQVMMNKTNKVKMYINK